jgi:hypothetical protein
VAGLSPFIGICGVVVGVAEYVGRWPMAHFVHTVNGEFPHWAFAFGMGHFDPYHFLFRLRAKLARGKKQKSRYMNGTTKQR